MTFSLVFDSAMVEGIDMHRTIVDDAVVICCGGFKVYSVKANKANDYTTYFRNADIKVNALSFESLPTAAMNSTVNFLNSSVHAGVLTAPPIDKKYPKRITVINGSSFHVVYTEEIAYTFNSESGFMYFGEIKGKNMFSKTANTIGGAFT
jgi:hypothetical protein